MEALPRAAAAAVASSALPQIGKVSTLCCNSLVVFEELYSTLGYPSMLAWLNIDTSAQTHTNQRLMLSSSFLQCCKHIGARLLVLRHFMFDPPSSLAT